jgi:hypothetical protein
MSNPGNGARAAMCEALFDAGLNSSDDDLDMTDEVLMRLWYHGFKVVAVDDATNEQEGE